MNLILDKSIEKSSLKSKFKGLSLVIVPNFKVFCLLLENSIINSIII